MCSWSKEEVNGEYFELGKSKAELALALCKLIKSLTCGEISKDGVKLASAGDLNVPLPSHWKIWLNNLVEETNAICNRTSYQDNLLNKLCTLHQVPIVPVTMYKLLGTRYLNLVPVLSSMHLSLLRSIILNKGS